MILLFAAALQSATAQPADPREARFDRCVALARTDPAAQEPKAEAARKCSVGKAAHALLTQYQNSKNKRSARKSDRQLSEGGNVCGNTLHDHLLCPPDEAQGQHQQNGSRIQRLAGGGGHDSFACEREPRL